MTGDRRLTIIVCSGPVCRDRRGSGELRAHLDATLAARGLAGRVRVFDEVCLGHCLRGPNILVEGEVEEEPGDGRNVILYDHMTIAELDRVLDRHLAGGMAIRIIPSRGR